jgi:hypothetical protein
VVSSRQSDGEKIVGSQSKRGTPGRVAPILTAALVVLGGLLGVCGSASAKEETALPAKIRAELLKDAKREAARLPSGERHPVDIQAVLTTEAQASRLENESTHTDLPCGGCGTSEVYLVAMIGHSPTDCKGAPGRLPSCSAHPPVVMFWVSPSTMKVSRGERASSYPNLSSAGVPVGV